MIIRNSASPEPRKGSEPRSYDGPKLTHPDLLQAQRGASICISPTVQATSDFAWHVTWSTIILSRHWASRQGISIDWAIQTCSKGPAPLAWVGICNCLLAAREHPSTIFLPSRSCITLSNATSSSSQGGCKSRLNQLARSSEYYQPPHLSPSCRIDQHLYD